MTSNSDINQGSAATTNGSGEVPFQGWEIRQVMIDQARQRYTQVTQTAVLEACNDFVLPDDAKAFVIDAALFGVYSAAIHLAAITGRAEGDRRALAIAYFDIERRIKNEVMTMLNEFVDEEKSTA